MAEFSRTSTTITVNGQTYSSVDEMPPEVRRQYEQVMSLMADRNNDGVPDILEGRPPGESTVVSQVTTTSADFKLGPGGWRELPSTRGAAPAGRAIDRNPDGGGGGGGGITIRITWPTVFALLVVIAIALLVWWVKAR